METLQCRTCGEVKELNLFQKSGMKLNGEQYYRPDCKECRKPELKKRVKIIDKKHKESSVYNGKLTGGTMMSHASSLSFRSTKTTQSPATFHYMFDVP
jgi:hypothetical protein